MFAASLPRLAPAVAGRIRASARMALALGVLLAVGAGVARAGDECVSSKLANQLLDCSHCQTMKKLLGHAAIGEVTMEIHELDKGAVVEIEAMAPEAVTLVHSLVEELWNTRLHCETELSGACQARFHALENVVVDRALSSHGAIVIVRSEDPVRVAWLREDARNARSILASAASR